MFFYVKDKIKSSLKSKTTKMIMDFNYLDFASIQLFAIKRKNDNAKLAT